MFIRAAATKVAKAAKEAAEKALEEKSPSRVGKRIGAFYTKGIALGIDDPKQIAAVRNASRFIGTDVTRTSYNSVSTDNRRTYNQDQSVTVNVEGLSVKDQMDVRALAVEISRLSRRTKYGHGGRDS